jgi:short-subunit dehydrogenase
VTGCTSGIGEAIARRFASSFNLILLSRSQERLEALDKELKSKVPSLETMIIVFDFKQEARDLEGIERKVRDRIAQKGDVMDLAVIVNNAGVNTRGYFRDISAEEIREMALVNTYPYTLLTRSLLPILKSRVDEQSLVINICSAISFVPSAFDAVYAATKIFEVFTMESLRLEQSQRHSNIRFLTMNPQYVSTNNARLHPGGMVDTPEAFADSMIAVLTGDQSVTQSCGTIKHNIAGFFIRLMQQSLRLFNWHQILNETIISKKAAVMWEKRI